MKFVDLTGQTFGRLTVIRQAQNRKWQKIQWECQCICGITTIVIGNSLRTGHTQSCGCLKKDLVVTHGMTYTVEYSTWCSMLNRCLNPKDAGFKNYGGRGITICDEWKNDFMAFFNHIGPRPSKHHSVERVNNNRSYEPGNIIWATRYEQNNNNRRNHRITVRDRTMNLSQWAKFVDIKYSTLKWRVQSGWSYENAIFQPVKH